MELKKGVLYDAIHKTQTYYDEETKVELKISMICEVKETARKYYDVMIYEKCGFELRKNDYIDIDKWDFYEIRDIADFKKSIPDLLDLQRLAVDLGNKDLFEKCKRDLTYMGYEGEKVG